MHKFSRDAIKRLRNKQRLTLLVLVVVVCGSAIA